MSKKEKTKPRKVKYLGCVGNAYYNNFCVDAYLLSDGNVLMEKLKLNRKVPGHSYIVSKDLYTERFCDENRSDYDNGMDALEFLEPPTH